MTEAIRTVKRQELKRLISSPEAFNLTKDEQGTFAQCLNGSTSLWVGYVGETPVCAWGLMPPTLLSDNAYLWLYTTEGIRGHEFIFVRNSQIAVKQMLEEYPLICGHTLKDSEGSIRWLKWLGAKFLEPGTKYVPFEIRKAA